MNKKIFILLFFMSVLISVSAVSAVDLDDNNGTVASSNDADALAIANDVNAIDDLNENDVKFVAVDKNKKNLLSAKENGVLSESDSNILSVFNEDVLAGNTITPTDFTFAAIQTAVDNAKDGDTISLKAGTYLNDENGNINIINKTISIVGVKDSTILDSQNKSGIFYTENNSTNITGIVFMNGVDDMYGGIFFNKVAGNVINCTFKNSRGSYGSAIYFDYSNGNVINCTFTDNSIGSAIRFYVAKSSVINCTFTNNTAGIEGGAIIVISTYCDIINCTFTNNTAETDGGGAISSDSGSCNMFNCTFTDNSAGYVGGAVKLMRFDCSFINCIFANNSGGDEGDAIYLFDSSITVNNCALVNNTASGNSEIYIDAGSFDLNNNWWGSNNPDWAKILGGYVPEVYAVLNLTANPCEISYDKISNITTKFVWNGTNNDATNLLPKRNVKLLSKGNLTETEGDVGLTSIFSAFIKDIYYVNATVDNETLEVNVKVNSSKPIVTNITVNTTSLDLTVGQNDSIIAELNPPEAGNLKYTYDDKIIDIKTNPGGNFTVTALAEGNTNITFSFPGNGDYLPAENKTVTVTVSLNDASVSGEDMALNVGETGAIKYSTNPKGLNVSFAEDNSGIVSVDEQGIVTALKEGTANVTITVGDHIYALNSTTVTVTVSLNDASVSGEDMALNVGETGAVKYITDPEGLKVAFIVDDSDVVSVDEHGIVTALKEGIANVTITVDDNRYALNSTTVAVSVSLNDASVSGEDMALNVGETAAIKYSAVPKGLDVSFAEDDSGVVSVDEHGIVTALKEGIANVTITVGDNKKYALNSTTVAVSVSLNDASVSGEDMALNVGETGAVKYSAVPKGLDVSFVEDGSGVVSVDEHGIVTALKQGSANITITVGDNKKYALNSTIICVNVHGLPSKIIIENDTLDMVIGDVVDPGVTLMPSDAGNLSFTVSDENIVLVNGLGVITAVGEGNATVTVSFGGNDKYLPSNATITVSVKNALIIKAPDVVKYYGGPERFVVNVTDSKGTPLSNKSVTIVINKVKYNRTTDENGIASMAIGLPSGTYNATVTVDNKTVNSVVNVLTTVNGTDVVKMYKNGTQYYATFIDSEGKYLADGTTVNFNINGVMYERKISGDKGQAKLNINLPAGKYVITAMNPITGENATNNVTVLSNIVENYDLIKYYKNASQYSLRLLDDKGNPVGAGVSVQFNINGVFYTRTSDANGYVKMNINLPPGTYIITAEYKGLKASNKITVLSVLETKDLVMKYGDGSKFEAKILDGQGRPYAGQTVKFNINGVFYTKTTGADGIARLNINLLPGQYIITSSYNGLNAANKVTISG